MAYSIFAFRGELPGGRSDPARWRTSALRQDSESGRTGGSNLQARRHPPVSTSRDCLLGQSARRPRWVGLKQKTCGVCVWTPGAAASEFVTGMGTDPVDVVRCEQLRFRQDNILRVTSPNGRWIAFACLCRHETRQTASDNIGRTVNYTYNADGQLWKVTVAQSCHGTYDTNHR